MFYAVPLQPIESYSQMFVAQAPQAAPVTPSLAPRKRRVRMPALPMVVVAPSSAEEKEAAEDTLRAAINAAMVDYDVKRKEALEQKTAADAIACSKASLVLSDNQVRFLFSFTRSGYGKTELLALAPCMQNLSAEQTLAVETFQRELRESNIAYKVLEYKSRGVAAAKSKAARKKALTVISQARMEELGLDQRCRQGRNAK